MKSLTLLLRTSDVETREFDAHHVEKGSIENAHRLLRRYIPKGKSIDKYVGQDLKPIADFKFTSKNL